VLGELDHGAKLDLVEHPVQRRVGGGLAALPKLGGERPQRRLSERRRVASSDTSPLARTVGGDASRLRPPTPEQDRLRWNRFAIYLKRESSSTSPD
jgi:hypothetical protein